jgi:flagellar biosynthesis protein FliQ
MAVAEEITLETLMAVLVVLVFQAVAVVVEQRLILEPHTRAVLVVKV